MYSIVLACGMSTSNLARYLTKILKVHTGQATSFIKYLMDKLKDVTVQDNEGLASFNVFTNILVPRVLDMINQLILDHQESYEMRATVEQSWYQLAEGLEKQR